MQSDTEADKAAILRLIEAEAAAFWNKDFDAYARCWVQEPYACRMGWWSRGGIGYRRGWSAIAARMREQIARSPTGNLNATRVRREDLNIRIGQEMAWVTFEQRGIETGDTAMDMPGLSHETRVLEKHNGEWKIALSSYLLED